MGRNFPVGDQNPTIIIIIHNFISTFFFIATITATIAVISSLCGSFYRKKTSQNDSKENKDPDGLSQEQTSENLTTTTPPPLPTSGLDNEIDIEQSLPPPPGMRNLSGAASYHVRSYSTMSKAATTRAKIESSRSMRVLGNGLASLRQGSKREEKLTSLRQGSKREEKDDKKKLRIQSFMTKDKHLKHEDSIWKKAIILGDKCRVPDEDEDRDTIICDEKGNRISTYHHRKNANSMALSRQSSAIDHDALTKKDDSFHKTKNNVEIEE